MVLQAGIGRSDDIEIAMLNDDDQAARNKVGIIKIGTRFLSFALGSPRP